jgi:hypothetical protein
MNSLKRRTIELRSVSQAMNDFSQADEEWLEWDDEVVMRIVTLHAIMTCASMKFVAILLVS